MDEIGRGCMWSSFVVDAYGRAEVCRGGMWRDFLWRHMEEVGRGCMWSGLLPVHLEEICRRNMWSGGFMWRWFAEACGGFTLLGLIPQDGRHFGRDED